MELFDIYFEMVLENVETKQHELDGIYQSIKKAVELNQYYELRDLRWGFCGFLTWEVRPNTDRPEMVDLGITNLVMLKKSRGSYNLMRATNYLRNRYKNIVLFIWKSRKSGKIVSIQQHINEKLYA